ncbi:MAG: hypothetical protein AABM66_09795 [Actinomycetota bacterium]
MLLERSAVAVGLMAASIAVGGFIARAYTVLNEDDDAAIRRATVVGGLLGLIGAVLTVILDVIAG